MPSSSLSLSQLQQIDRVCDSFEAAWRAGRRPRIEDFLESTTVEERTELFRELLAREVELRKEAGESPEAAEYEDRFQVFVELIRTVLCREQSGQTLLLPQGATDPGTGAALPGTGDRTEPNTTVAQGLGGFGGSHPDEGEIHMPERIGRYRPIRLLGRANFLVFLARDDQNGRDVAIKVARPEDALGRRRLMSLAEEAQRLATLNHPGIVKVHEYVAAPDDNAQDGRGDGFIVLEYIEGSTLEQLLVPNQPLPPARLVEILATVAEAVHHAHTAGLVHRDLKPSNILIDTQGRPRVCDFGLAVDEEIQRLRRGEVAGTLPYMSPEQVRGETNRLDGRTDVWALGIILYRGLTGRLPFRGARPVDCFDEILHREPRPPRQVSDAVPRELERICLRCLSRPMNERYLTAADLADELRAWLARSSAEPAAEPAHVPVPFPRGLRTFGSAEAAAFLSLVPGPRGSDGLPESIRFWKARIETREGETGFCVGLVYGSSGGGKSSFVKAGLLPNLERSRVRSIYLEASPEGTEARLLAELRWLVPPLPREGDLADAIAMLRDDPHVRPREQTLFVIDQFEQWLQGRVIDVACELVRALRQCDGRHVQALLLVRDDFWMATTRLFRAIEVPLVEGFNAVSVELFDGHHARRVLEEFGRSLGRIPAGASADHGELAQFLDRAVAGLTESDGRVIPVRLSLFVEVVRDRPWTLQTLRNLGGMDGIGVKFLEESFGSQAAPPAHRIHREAAEAVLRLLLPTAGTSLRGAPHSATALREASGYADRPGDYADLFQILDHDLRLITPVELPVAETAVRGERPGGDSVQPPAEPHFQLAHDYLIGPIRQWLQRKQRATRSGRARLRLEAVTAAWLERPRANNLPSLLEYSGILLNTRTVEWSRDERRLMNAALGHYLRRLGAVLFLITASLLVAAESRERRNARMTLSAAFTAKDRDLMAMIDRLEPYRTRVMGELEAAERALDQPDRERVARTLLYRFQPTAERGTYLRGTLLLATDPDGVELICDVLASHPEHAGIDQLWNVLASDDREAGARLRAACAIAALDYQRAAGLFEFTAVLARGMLDEGVRDVPHWLNLLEPALPSLVDPLGRLCSDRETDHAMQAVAAEAIAEILKRQGDTKKLAAILVSSQPEASRILLNQLEKLGRPLRAIGVLQAVVESSLPESSDEKAREQLARRQALAAGALEVLGQPEALWRYLSDRADPRRRSQLIERPAARGHGQHRLLEELNAPHIDPLERQALLMIWAETPLRDVTAQVGEEVVEAAERLYRDDPDPGVHSAAELLLRRWKGLAHVLRLEAELRRLPTDGQSRQWRLGPNGHTFAIIRGPLAYRMGSPNGERGRFDDEVLHYRSIARTLGVSTKEVTIEQYQALDKARLPDGRYTLEPGAPVNDISWLDAARYCNLLSRLDGIPQAEWCYPETIEHGMMLPECSADRIGYRLPTEAEWEYLCRAGTVTSRPFGGTEELLDRYGWTWINSDDHAWPVGQLLPNQFGLFDMLGNVWEWCHDGGKKAGRDVSPPYPRNTSRERPAGDLAAGGVIDDDSIRMLRGGAFDYSPSYARSAGRYHGAPGYKEGTYGFRVVRTLPPGIY
jgi:serine/threonine protein kinase/formylglycine-generating enzyme required for sulfatase activity